MTWLAVHPANTRKQRVPDEDGAPTFDLGFWPPLVAETVNALLARVRASRLLEQLDPIRDNVELRQSTELKYELVKEMVRYGVRGWSGLVVAGEDGKDQVEIAAELEEVEVDGRKHRRLTDAACEVLHVNGLTVQLAQACQLFNGMTEAQKKTSGSLLPSAASRSGTSASAASLTGPAAPPAASSASKAPSSTAAPSS